MNKPIRTSSIDELLDRIQQHRREDDPQHRLLVAIVGPPGAGKSTLSEALRARVEHSEIIPMDGFHLDNRLLDLAGQRDVKGAPQTFDAFGLLSLLQRLARRDEPVHVPVFDRDADLSRAAACTVLPEHRTLWVEGNYLLLKDAPWSSMQSLFDVTVSLDVSIEELRRRLIQRWLDHGLEQEAAVARAEHNDIPNGLRVIRESNPADIVYTAG